MFIAVIATFGPRVKFREGLTTYSLTISLQIRPSSFRNESEMSVVFELP